MFNLQIFDWKWVSFESLVSMVVFRNGRDHIGQPVRVACNKRAYPC